MVLGVLVLGIGYCSEFFLMLVCLYVWKCLVWF